MRHIAALFLLVFLLCGTARAADDGLYEAPPSPDATFVRTINLMDNDSARPLRADRKILDAASFAEATPYFTLRRGAVKLTIGDQSVTKILQAKKFYTLVEQKGKLTVMEDDVKVNREKAVVTLLNYSSKPEVSLKTADGKTEIIKATSTGKANSREMNAVKVDMQASDGKDAIKIGEKTLERGMIYTVLIYDDHMGKTKASFIEAQIQAAK